MKKRILFVEDDDVIRENYTEILTEEGFEVEAFNDRKSALFRAKESLPDLALLDISLGEEREAGFQLCADLRQLSTTMPIIFLTSHDREIDKISGMRLGADDYITKDLSIDFLIVRIEALFRRIQAFRGKDGSDENHQKKIVRHHLTIDMDKLLVYWKDKQVDLTLTQLWIVHELALRPGHVKSHSKLMEAAKVVVEPNTIASHVKTIRARFKAVDEDFNCIRTEYSAGYRWVDS